MNSNWETVKLGDFISIQSGLSYKGEFIGSGSNYLLGMGCVSNKEMFLDAGARLYSGEYKSQHIVKPGDIVLATRQQSDNLPILGMPAIIPTTFNDSKIIVGSNLYKVFNNSEIENEFIYWLMKSYDYQNYIKSVSTGTTVRMITKQNIENYTFKLPPINNRKLITKCLNNLNNKIELNRKMNQTLEEMASAIFKSWFVDFDPVHAKANCTDESELENIAKELGISKAILDLFPSEFEESELGMIPKGWEVKTIKDFGRVVTGKTPPSKIEDAYNDDGKPFITPTDIDDSLFLVTTNRHLSANGEIAIKNTIIPTGSICVTCIGSQMGKTIISPYDACTNQQINSIIVNSNNLRNYLFCNLRNRKNEIFLMGSGGSTMPLLNKSTFEKMKVLLPQQDILNKFDILVKDKLLLVLKNDLENITLSKIRNNLLPKLLSGEIEV